MQTYNSNKIFILTILIICINLSFAQKCEVEKSIYEIQVGSLGVWIHNERKLTNNVSLRIEFGMDTGVFGGSFYPKTGYLMTPVITLEPRWYYNFDKRLSKSKNIIGNSGNFLTIKTSYNPNWFAISNYDNVKIVNQVSIIPTWGIKRKIGEYFTFETGLGLGYRYYFTKSAGYSKNESSGVINLHLRVGYKF